MWKNYLKIAWRNIQRNKLRTLVHLLGLSIGIAVCLLVFHIVHFEYSFDRFHPDGERIYQVNTETISREESWKNGGVPFPIAGVIKDEIPEVEQKTHFYILWDVKINGSGREKIYRGDNNIILADNDFFDLFPRQWLAGNPATALVEVNQVVLTESASQLYFDGLSPDEVIGKELTYTFMDTIQASVVGVVGDYKENSDFIFTDFLSINNILEEGRGGNYDVAHWNSVNSSSKLFVKLYPQTNPADLDPKFAAIVDKYMENEEGFSTEYSLMPISEIHFHENFDQPGADRTVLQGLVIIGFFILIMACMNFINLETAQSIIRSKEVGIRKTLGCRKSQLILQFLSEIALIVFIALMTGIILSELLAKYFQDFLPKGLVIDYFSKENILFLAVLGVILTFVSGLFPALILARYQPHKAITQDLRRPDGFSIGHFLQKNLTVVQFALSIGFIISVLVISDQINFMANKELGFDKEQVMYVRMPMMTGLTNKESFKAAIDNQSSTLDSSIGNDIIASNSLWTSKVSMANGEEKKEVGVQIKNIDQEYLGVFGVNLISGRNIRNIDTEVLINQTLLNALGEQMEEDVLGRVLMHNEVEYQVVGVVPNFHSRSLREEIRPMIMYYRPQNSSMLSLRIAEGTDLYQAKQTLISCMKIISLTSAVNSNFLMKPLPISTNLIID